MSYDITITLREHASSEADVYAHSEHGRAALARMFPDVLTQPDHVTIPKTKAIDLSLYWRQKGLACN